jgi:hypothetical protein
VKILAEDAPLKKLRAARVVEDVKRRDDGDLATVEALGLLYQRRYRIFLRVAEAIVGDESPTRRKQ